MIPSILPTYAPLNLTPEYGKGVYLFDAENKRYLDFSAGIAVNCLGHAHPYLIEALKKQADKLWHISNILPLTNRSKLASRLVAETFADTVYFGNSGLEANEAAIKMTRRYHYTNNKPEKYRIVTFEGAFHGRSLATIAAGGQQKLLEGFGPKVDGFDQVEFENIAKLKEAITAETAGIMLEPIQGESGIRAFSADFLRELRAICDEKDLLLIYDEIQTGMGRTGYLYDYERTDIEPDILTTAKGLGGGFPIGACLATEKAAKGMVVGTHGSTFGGNPLAMAVGNAVLDIIIDDGFIENVRKSAKYLSQKLDMLTSKHNNIIKGHHGIGLMIGIDCEVNNKEFQIELVKEGLISVVAGNNVLRLLPPLIIDKNHIDEAIDILEKTCIKLENK